MKQKYRLIKDSDKNELIIQEEAELDKDQMAMICEERINWDIIEQGIDLPLAEFASRIRTKNMYPPWNYATKIAQAVIQLYQNPDMESTEVAFDDMELFWTEIDEGDEDVIDEIEDDGADIDELLEDEIDDDFGEENPINTIQSNIKLTGEDSLNIEDDD